MFYFKIALKSKNCS